MPTFISPSPNRCRSTVEGAVIPSSHTSQHEIWQERGENGSLHQKRPRGTTAPHCLRERCIHQHHHVDDIKLQDSCSCLPLHLACRNRNCNFVIQTLIETYPTDLGVFNKRRRTPLVWDYSNKSQGQHSTEFIQYVVESKEDEVNGTNETELRECQRRIKKKRHRLLGQCKNYVPLDVLKKGYFLKTACYLLDWVSDWMALLVNARQYHIWYLR